MKISIGVFSEPLFNIANFYNEKKELATVKHLKKITHVPVLACAFFAYDNVGNQVEKLMSSVSKQSPEQRVREASLPPSLMDANFISDSLGA